MLINIALWQAVLLGIFVSWERLVPANFYAKPNKWDLWWVGICATGASWLRVLLWLWLALDFQGLIELPGSWLLQGFIFYAIYSFGMYWMHRIKHSWSWLWRYVHRLHHAPAHMESKIAYWRHPVEMLINSVYLVIIGGYVFGLSPEAIAVTLAIEASLETFHHANIKFPARLFWVGYIIQTPPMHLVHHEFGQHRWNYAPFLWDAIFRTIRFAPQDGTRLGFTNSHDIGGYFWLTEQRRPLGGKNGTSSCTGATNES